MDQIELNSLTVQSSPTSAESLDLLSMYGKMMFETGSYPWTYFLASGEQRKAYAKSLEEQNNLAKKEFLSLFEKLYAGKELVFHSSKNEAPIELVVDHAALRNNFGSYELRTTRNKQEDTGYASRNGQYIGSSTSIIHIADAKCSGYIDNYDLRNYLEAGSFELTSSSKDLLEEMLSFNEKRF